jgi:chromosome segregation ATPase
MHEVVEVRSTALAVTRVPNRTPKKIVFPALVLTTVCLAAAVTMFLPAERVDVLAHQLSSLWSSALANTSVSASLADEKHAHVQGPQDYDKADSLARDLAAVREQVAALEAQAHAAQLTAARATEAVAQSQEALIQERQKSDRFAQELAAASDELKTLAAQADAAKLAAARATEAGAQSEDALNQERDKSDTLARELAAALDQAKALRTRADAAQLIAARTTEAGARPGQLRQERKKVDGLSRRITSRHATQVARTSADELSADSFFWKKQQ